MLPIITKKEADLVLNQGDGLVHISLDLGLSVQEVMLKDGFVSIQNQKIPLVEFEHVKEEACYVADENILKIVAYFSEETNFYYKLIPTNDWPTITLSSTPMHRHIHISPKKSAKLMITKVTPLNGNVLDTCCGLGYTAILAAKHAEKVYTFERDKYVINLASYNPYSQELFSNKKIELIENDVVSGIMRFKNNFFSRIIHDPPTFKYSPDLYSEEFYKAMFRVLRKGGKLYHYAPCPQKTKNKVFYNRIIRHLKACGFRNMRYDEISSGVSAEKF